MGGIPYEIVGSLNDRGLVGTNYKCSNELLLQSLFFT